MDKETRNRICSEIAEAMLTNYDEKASELEEPTYSILLDGFEMPKGVDIPEDCFVDELYGYEGDIKNGYVDFCFSHIVDGDCIERVDEIDLMELDDEYLERVYEYVKNHNGAKIG